MANTEEYAEDIMLPRWQILYFFFKFRSPSLIALKIDNNFEFICYDHLIQRGRKVSDIIIELDISTSLCKAG